MSCCKPKFTNDDTSDEREYEINIQTLIAKQRKLEFENKALKEKLELADREWARNVDAFVDTWFEENKDDVDIGVIDFRFFKLDLFPDYLEKHIYKKVIKIVYSFMMSAIAPKDSNH